MWTSYKVFQFRNGEHRVDRGQWASPADAIDSIRKQSELRDGITDVVETELRVIANPPSSRDQQNLAKHSLAHLERLQPDTLFVCAIETEAFRRMSREADAMADNREEELQLIIHEAIRYHRNHLSWDEMRDEWKVRIQRPRGDEDCWLWHKEQKQGEYRNVYAHMKGAIPVGAVVRHICDDRRCVNPNHLTLGTHRDNMQDMLERKRHWRQKLKIEREARRARDLRRKAAKKLSEANGGDTPSPS